MPGSIYAQAAPGAFDMLNSLIVPTMLIIGIMYFLMIRPQQKRLKEHRDMVAGYSPRRYRRDLGRHHRQGGQG